MILVAPDTKATTGSVEINLQIYLAAQIEQLKKMVSLSV